MDGRTHKDIDTRKEHLRQVALNSNPKLLHAVLHVLILDGVVQKLLFGLVVGEDTQKGRKQDTRPRE